MLKVFTRRLGSASRRTHYQPPYRRGNSTQSSSSPPTPPGTASSSRAKYLRTFSAVSVATTFYVIGSLYPPTFATWLSPRPAPAHPDAAHPLGVAHIASVEESLLTLPVLTAHRSRHDAHEWYETRPYLGLPAELKANKLTAGSLSGPGKLAVPPVVRARRDESECWLFIHVGTALCGHEGFVHGGLLATLLDEAMGRMAVHNLPEKVGMTANLNLNYRAPTRANQFIVIKTRHIETIGRKTRVEGTIEDMDGTVLVEATALFVQPRMAKLFNTTALKQMMGSPPPSVTPSGNKVADAAS